MSGQCTGWLLRHGPRPDDLDLGGRKYGLPRARALRAVLMPIADAANRDGEESHPGLQAIIDASLYSRRQVFRVLDDARAEGWVEITGEPSKGHATVYAVNMAWRDASATMAPQDQEPEPGRGATLHALGCQNGAVGVPPGGTPDGNRDGLRDEPPSLSGLQPDVERLCELLADLIEANGSKRPAVGKTWHTEMDRLLRIDGRTPEQVERAIRWCQADAFWRANIMSVPTLRKQYDRLRLAAKRDGGGRPPAFDNTDARRAEPGGRIRL